MKIQDPIVALRLILSNPDPMILRECVSVIKRALDAGEASKTELATLKGHIEILSQQITTLKSEIFMLQSSIPTPEPKTRKNAKA